MLNVIFWIIFGFLTGWVSAILAASDGREARTAPLILAGVVGGVVGGASIQLLTTGTLAAEYNPSSLFGAVFLAAVMTAIATLLRQEPTSQ